MPLRPADSASVTAVWISSSGYFVPGEALPPAGPVFVSLPMDDFDQPADEGGTDLLAARRVTGRSVAAPARIGQAGTAAGRRQESGAGGRRGTGRRAGRVRRGRCAGRKAETAGVARAGDRPRRFPHRPPEFPGQPPERHRLGVRVARRPRPAPGRRRPDLPVLPVRSRQLPARRRRTGSHHRRSGRSRPRTGRRRTGRRPGPYPGGPRRTRAADEPARPHTARSVEDSAGSRHPHREPGLRHPRPAVPARGHRGDRVHERRRGHVGSGEVPAIGVVLLRRCGCPRVRPARGGRLPSSRNPTGRCSR